MNEEGEYLLLINYFVPIQLNNCRKRVRMHIQVSQGSAAADLGPKVRQ